MRINTTFGSALLALLTLLALPVIAGESAPSAKDAFAPASDWSKGGLTPSPLSAKAPIPSAKDIIPSAKSAKGAMIPPPSQSRWVLGGGLAMRRIGEVDFDTGVTNLTIPRLFQAGNTPVPGIGAPNGFANRIYNDGFVRPDLGTPATTRTTDYGYQNNGQIQGNNLVYNADGGERRDVMRRTSAAATDWTEERDWELAPYLKLSRLSEVGDGWSAGPAVHFSFTNVNGSRPGLNTILGREQLDIFDISATDTYDATGLPLPRAPYIGAPNIVAPLLPAAPATRVLTDTLRSTDVAVWSDSVSESLDVDLWGISLGGEAVYQFQDRFFASLGAGLVANVADWEAKRSDTLFQQINNGAPVAIGASNASNSGTDLLLGFYFQAAAGYQLTESFAVEANLRYDVSQSLRDSVGNSSFDVDLSGLTIGLGGNYTFW